MSNTVRSIALIALLTLLTAPALAPLGGAPSRGAAQDPDGVLTAPEIARGPAQDPDGSHRSRGPDQDPTAPLARPGPDSPAARTRIRTGDGRLARSGPAPGRRGSRRGSSSLVSCRSEGAGSRRHTGHPAGPDGVSRRPGTGSARGR